MPPIEPAVYTLEEAAVRLNMSKRALLPYVQAGFCGAFQLGPHGSWKIPRKKLDQFIENGGQLESAKSNTGTTRDTRKSRKGSR